MQVNITLQNSTAVADLTTLHKRTSDFAKFRSVDHNYRVTFLAVRHFRKAPLMSQGEQACSKGQQV